MPPLWSANCVASVAVVTAPERVLCAPGVDRIFAGFRPASPVMRKSSYRVCHDGPLRKLSRPQRILWLDATLHVDLYDTEPYVTQAVEAVTAFLTEHL